MGIGMGPFLCVAHVYIYRIVTSLVIHVDEYKFVVKL